MDRVSRGWPVIAAEFTVGADTVDRVRIEIVEIVGRVRGDRGSGSRRVFADIMRGNDFSFRGDRSRKSRIESVEIVDLWT